MRGELPRSPDRLCDVLGALHGHVDHLEESVSVHGGLRGGGGEGHVVADLADLAGTGGGGGGRAGGRGGGVDDAYTQG